MHRTVASNATLTCPDVCQLNLNPYKTRPHTAESITGNLDRFIRCVAHAGLHMKASVREGRDITFGPSVEVQHLQRAAQTVFTAHSSAN